MPDGSTTARNGLAFEDDKIDFNLGSTTTIGHDELEDPFIDEAETRSLNTVKSIDAATAPEDELDFGLTQANDSTIAPKDEDLLSEIDWCDPSAPEDQAQEETPPTPSSATKRSRPEDEVELDTQQG